jgi:hypothetical protein
LLDHRIAAKIVASSARPFSVYAPTKQCFTCQTWAKF